MPDILLILAGKVSIDVNGRRVAERQAGLSIGEMGAVDVSVPRSATVSALESTVVARVTASDFIRIANQHPAIWQELCRDLADRLRQRNSLVNPSPRSCPVVFVGSSVEGLPIARAIQAACLHDDFIVRLWTDSVFRASLTSAEALDRELPRIDFSLIVLTADDETTSRGSTEASPRDNLVGELFLSWGRLGRARTFFVRVQGQALKIPSDWFAVNSLSVKAGSDDDLAARVGPAVTELRRQVKDLGGI